MASPSQQTLAVFELTEAILLHLDNPVDIVRMQRVCRHWRDVITISPLLQEACWYRPFSNLTTPGQPDIINSTSTNTEKGAEKPIWKVNPAFERVGMDLYTRNDPPQKHGHFSLQTRVYDKPGSWTTMLATQPPRTQVEFDIDCYHDDALEQTINYWIQSTGQPLLVGDIMAVLAECQNRQECGVDRWYADIEHRDGDMLVGTEKEWLEQRPDRELEEIPDDVSIKVAFAKNTPWGGWCPAFSLRRLESSMAPGMNFLHEMQLYTVAAVRGKEYERHDGNGFTPVCSSGGEYQANLVVVRDYDHPYLEDCRHIYRLLSDVERN